MTAARATTRRLGLGIGWRPETDVLAARPGLGFVEAVAESVDPRRPPAGLLAARERGMAVIPHGISLSLGGAERPDGRRLAHLAAVAEASARRWSASTSRSCAPAGGRPDISCLCREHARRWRSRPRTWRWPSKRSRFR